MILYWLAIALIGLAIIVFVSLCIFAAFAALITKCCAGTCIQLRMDQAGDAIIQFPSKCLKYLLFLTIVIGLFGFVMCIVMWEFYFAWLFVGGPSHSVYFADFNKNADSVIYWLFILCLALSISALLGTQIGVCYSVCYDQDDDE